MENAPQNYFKESPLGCECNEALRAQSEHPSQDSQPATPPTESEPAPPVDVQQDSQPLPSP